MTLNRAFLTAALIALASPAAADCPAGAEPFVSCVIKEDALQMEACFNATEFSFEFGRFASPPDVSVTLPLSEVAVQPWNGMGSSYSEAASFTHAGITYSLWWSADRMTDEHPITGGVTLTEDGTELSSLTCAVEPEIGGLWVLPDAKDALGK